MAAMRLAAQATRLKCLLAACRLHRQLPCPLGQPLQKATSCQSHSQSACRACADLEHRALARE